MLSKLKAQGYKVLVDHSKRYCINNEGKLYDLLTNEFVEPSLINSYDYHVAYLKYGKVNGSYKVRNIAIPRLVYWYFERRLTRLESVKLIDPSLGYHIENLKVQHSNTKRKEEKDMRVPRTENYNPEEEISREDKPEIDKEDFHNINDTGLYC